MQGWLLTLGEAWRKSTIILRSRRPNLPLLRPVASLFKLISSPFRSKSLCYVDGLTAVKADLPILRYSPATPW